MHPANIYADRRPDFAQLAQDDIELAKHVVIGPTGASIDFTNAAALRALTAALLRHDFQLSVELRDDRLCPTIANRLDYVLTALDFAAHGPPVQLKALDVGTGHVAIYPLLLHRLRPTAQIMASEIDPTSSDHAAKVLKANDIPDSAVKLVGGCEDGYSLLSWLGPTPAPSTDGKPAEPPTEWSFTLCNPPFFSSAEEAQASRDLKAGPAPAASTCSTNEEITRGGEELFVGQLIEESRVHRTRCGWYTSLVGRYSSLEPLVTAVKAKTDNYAVLSLRQARTTRWVLVWGYTPYRLPDSITRPHIIDPTTSFARMLPLSNTFSVRPQQNMTIEQVRAAVLPVLESVGLTTPATPATAMANTDGAPIPASPTVTEPILIAPTTNAWSRAARRAAQRAAEAAQPPPSSDKASVHTQPPPAPTEPLFRSKLVFLPAPENNTTGAGVALEWTWGRDRGEIDAFWKFLVAKAGLMKRPVEDGEEGRVNGGEESARGRGHAFRGGRGRGRGGRGRGSERGRGRGHFHAPRDHGYQ